MNTVENVRKELRSNGVDDDALRDAQIKRMIAAATGKTKFVVAIGDIEGGYALTKGRAVNVLTPRARTTGRKK
jgi:hypothetical protein